MQMNSQDPLQSANLFARIEMLGVGKKTRERKRMMRTFDYLDNTPNTSNHKNTLLKLIRNAINLSVSMIICYSSKDNLRIEDTSKDKIQPQTGFGETQKHHARMQSSMLTNNPKLSREVDRRLMHEIPTVQYDPRQDCHFT
ncbi:TPA_asm: P8 [Justicia betacytorhabdovirus 1]|nr:TPA_asm: P8 [Justicia betacytorhabdovirus 1]